MSQQSLQIHGGEVHTHGEATVIEAPPSIVTEANCEKHGLTRRAFRKVLRAGLASVELPEVGRAVALADLLEWMRARGDVMPPATGGNKQANDTAAAPDDAALLAQGGVRLRSVGGAR